MTARDQRKESDRNRGRNRTPPKEFRPPAVPMAKKPRPVVSDHAVLRYMERVMGLDVEMVRTTMLTATQLAMAKSLREVELPIGGGNVAVVQGGRVVTVY